MTVLAHPHLMAAGHLRHAAWYPKLLPTFADALALVRRQPWQHPLSCASTGADDIGDVPRAVIAHLTEALCYAA